MIRAFAVGRLGEDEWAVVAAHVEQCAECQRQLDVADEAVDPLLTHLRRLPAGGTGERQSESQLSEAVISRTAGSSIAVALDAGRDLARRMALGPVRLGRFELLSELGVGSFGYVFRAFDPQLQREVALKVQRAGSFAGDEEIERFQREARSAAQLKHPAIVGLYEIGRTDDGVCYLVCELIDGVTLEQRLKQPRRTSSSPRQGTRI
jgi:hypothetical protein